MTKPGNLTKLKVKNIRKLRPFDPIEVTIPTGPGAAYFYRRYENGTWYRSDDLGKSYGTAASALEIGLLCQLMILWAKIEGVA